MKKLLILALLLTALDAKEKEIGRVTAIRGDVNITRGVALYQAHINLDIQESDTFYTSPHGSMQITFADNTVITLGKSTVFKVSEYIYDEGKRKAKAKFKFQKGFFKSITGRIGKISPKKFEIKTKNSTIGVRGTEITGKSTQTTEEIVCTYGEIAVKSGKKEFVAKANEKVEIELDPRVEYTIATAVDIMVQEQVILGVKKADDPEVLERPKAAITVDYKPEVKKELIAQGINPKTAPIIRNDTIKEAEKVEEKELEKLEKGFTTSHTFKKQETLREEIEVFTEKVIKEEAIKQESIEKQELKEKKLEEKKIKSKPYVFKPIEPEIIDTYKPFMQKATTNSRTQTLQKPLKEMQKQLINNHLSQSIENIRNAGMTLP